MSIQVQKVYKSFGEENIQVLKDVSFEVQDNEFVALTGRSGSGKSTLLYIVSTLDQPTSGEVLFDRENVRKFDQEALHRFRNQSIGFVFQFHYLLAELTALENVLMPARKFHQETQQRKFAAELLDLMGLSHRLNHMPRQLSGGEQQRVAIARALVMKPKYLFADEPTGNLDTANGEMVMSLLNRAVSEFKTAIVMVTHDTGFASRAHRQIVLSDGEIVHQSHRE